MKLCVVGTGYVGLVTGTCFADVGNHVVGADVDASKIAKLEHGELPIYEPGLDAMVARNVAAGRLRFTTDLDAAVSSAEVVFIAVGTPPRRDGGADLGAVDNVAQLVAARAAPGTVLVCKSTVPVGTNARVRRIVANAPHKVHVVSNPEFLKEGAAVNDFMKPDRIVVGVEPGDEHARDVMRRLYHPVSLSGERLVIMDPASAELTKYVANTILAMRISFMNEIAMLCERVGADIHKVRLGVGTDGRIGPKFLHAGPGYGGSCFPKDVQALAHTASDNGILLELAAATHRVNETHKGVLARKIKARLDGDVRGKRIAIWGLAFKPGTDDVRESPALTLVDVLAADGAELVGHDPEAKHTAKAVLGDKIRLVDDAYDAVKDADALALVTEWREYQSPDFQRLRSLMRRPYVIDGRNIWSDYGLRKQGFEYEGVGVLGS
jgi:UDPglucose 6-dehydrogenase